MRRRITLGLAAGLALALLPIAAEAQQCGPGYYYYYPYYPAQTARTPAVGPVYRSYSYQPGAAMTVAPGAPRYGYGYGYGYGNWGGGMTRGGAWTNATNKALGRY